MKELRGVRRYMYMYMYMYMSCMYGRRVPGSRAWQGERGPDGTGDR